jgi:hypothetical protein
VGRELKELRNNIVHEYDPAVAVSFSQDIIHYSKIAIKTHQQLENYLAETLGFEE